MTIAEKVITNEVAALLPKVVTDYLWLLAEYTDIQFFLLARQQLGGKDIQEIIHVADPFKESRRYQVFGFPPVNAAIRIVQDGMTCRMECCGPLEAAGLAAAC